MNVASWIFNRVRNPRNPQHHKTSTDTDGMDDDQDGDIVTSNSQEEAEQSSPPPPPSLPIPESPRASFQDDMERWKGLYEVCRAKLQELMAQGEGEELRGQAARCWLELQAEMQAAARTLSEEHAQVEAALERHNAVLLGLLERVQHMLEPHLPGSDQPQESVNKETIGLLKGLIMEHDMLSLSVQEERAKHGRDLELLEERAQDQGAGPAGPAGAEDKLRRTSSLLQLQVKRLQYELSRLTQTQAIETQAVLKLLEQSEADLRVNTALVEEVAQSNRELRNGDIACRQGRRASMEAFLDILEQEQRYRELRARLHSRLHSDRVYREVDQLDDEADTLAVVNQDLSRDIADLNESERVLESQWQALRLERDELTAHLYPDLQRVQELQDIAKRRLELETKLRKENFLFKRQLEDFQRDLLDVETDLLTGHVSRRTRATKNIVTQLNLLRDTIQQQNQELWQEMQEKELTIRSDDSLASAIMSEEEFRQHITNTMKKMELRINEDLDRRALLKPKKFVFETPGKAKVPFRGQRNVIKVPPKVAADWRRKTTSEIHREELMERQVDNLRRDILSKLALEKELAKRQLLQYESEQHGAMAGPGQEDESEASIIPNDVRATEQLRSILGQLDSFLHRKGKRGSSPQAVPSAVPSACDSHAAGTGGTFGGELKALIFQLEKLQSALGGSSARGREPKSPGSTPGTALERGRALFEQLPEAQASISRTGTGRRDSSSSTEREGA